MISFEEFKQLDLQVGTIEDVQEHPNADKLVKLSADIGEQDPVQLVAGVKGYYEDDELIGKQIVILTNMEPATIRGERSEGMLLAATTSDDVALIGPDQEVPPGTDIE
jgi:methionine--tRNA ligase beta chain